MTKTLPIDAVFSGRCAVVTLGEITAGDCPASLSDMHGGYISRGCFFPAGSVAAHFFEEHRHLEAQRAAARLKVYFARSGNRVKIGVSANPKARIKQLKTASAEPVRLMGACTGGRKLEKALHRRFETDRIAGEWFRLTNELQAAIRECCLGRDSA